MATNTYVVEIELKGHDTPEYVVCYGLKLPSDTEHEAKRQAVAEVTSVGYKPTGRNRVLVLRETDPPKMRLESLRQFVGPKMAFVVPTLAEWTTT